MTEKDGIVELAQDIDKKRKVAAKKEDAILEPLLPEINRIVRPEIQEFVRAVLYQAPPQFWTMPSSWNNYNPPDERGEGGAVLHVKRATRAYVLLCESRVQDRFDVDLGLAAILIHCILKGGIAPDDEGLNPYHSVQMDGWLRELRAMDLDQEADGQNPYSSTARISDSEFEVIARLVRVHMGRFSPVPELIPLTQKEWEVHQADYIATSLHWLLDGDEAEVSKRWAKR